MFDKRKAVQLATFFAKAEGGKINYMKLIKLMYLVERDMFIRHGYSTVGDDLYFMKMGPVLSKTLNAIKTPEFFQDELWGSVFSEPADYDITLKLASVSRDDLKALNDAEVESATEVWAKFGGYDQFRLRDYTHDLPEWDDPVAKNVKRLDVNREAIAKSAGLSTEVAAEMVAEVEADDYLDRMFAAA